MESQKEQTKCRVIPFPKVKQTSGGGIRPSRKTKNRQTLLSLLLYSLYDQIDPRDLPDWPAVEWMEGNGNDVTR